MAGQRDKGSGGILGCLDRGEAGRNERDEIGAERKSNKIYHVVKGSNSTKGPIIKVSLLLQRPSTSSEASTIYIALKKKKKNKWDVLYPVI